MQKTLLIAVKTNSDGRKDGRTDRQTDGQRDGQMDGGMDGQKTKKLRNGPTDIAGFKVACT